MIIPTENSWYFIFYVKTSNVFWQDESNFKNEIRRSCKQEIVPENNIVKPAYLKIQKSDQGNYDISFSKNFFFFCSIA
jgi:outer membrane protein assembly factor BamE (lipoprotein component of BamABCDE complex)